MPIVSAGADAQSNMVILEINFPSGFVVDKDSLKKLSSSVDVIKRVETKNSDTLAVIYFDNLTKNSITLKLDAFQTHEVKEHKPASVTIYDYYDSCKLLLFKGIISSM